MATLKHVEDFINAVLDARQRRAGKARMKKLTKEQRRKLARKAGLASAAKRKKHGCKNLR